MPIFTDEESQCIRPYRTRIDRILTSRTLSKLLKNYIIFRRKFTESFNYIHNLSKHFENTDDKRAAGTLLVGLVRPVILDAPLQERAGQCCFLCLTKRTEQVAVRIPCFRPTTPREVMKRRGSTKFYQKLKMEEKARESDSEIFRRFITASFMYHGTWKRWIPFYGVIAVREVTFQFIGVVDRDDSLPIRMTSLDITKIKKEAENVMRMDPHLFPNPFGGDVCDDGGHHSSQCGSLQDNGERCILVQVDQSRHRLKGLNMLDMLTKCAIDPAKANIMSVLDGCAQESCIYPANGSESVVVPKRYQPYENTNEVRGLHFRLGWQRDRLRYELPIKIAGLWITISIIWVCVIIWGGKRKDWNTAMGFGNLIAACIALVVIYLREQHRDS